MEEKRRDAGSPSPVATISGGSSAKSVESPATEPPAPRRRGQKRKSTSSSSVSGSSSAPTKRHAREKSNAAANAVSSLLPPIHNGPLTRARQLSDTNAAISSALNAIKNEPSMAPSAPDSAGDASREEVNVAKANDEALVAAIEAEFEAIRSRDANVHVVPVAAGWFSWTNIHSLEKQAFVSFFNGKSESRTPEIYIEIRNWIMKRFHANPSMNIELKDLSELSIGDSDARQEVMEFLDHWGLINYHPFLPNDDPNADSDNAEKMDPLIEKLYQFKDEQPNPQIVPKGYMPTLATAAGLFNESAIAEELIKQEGPAVEYHCNSCSADCSRKRYHCQKQADFDLCFECYNNGKFGSGMSLSDFILMEPAEASGTSGGKWTDQETLLLLEALELYKENWNEIAEHVATKTKAQCILHFLQMPIEDSFLDYDDTTDGVQDIPQPSSTNNEPSVPKDNPEPSESKTCKESSEPAEDRNGQDDSEPAESRSGKDNSKPAESKSDKQTFESSENRSGKDDLDPSQRKTDPPNGAQPVSALMEISNPPHVQDGKANQDKGDDVVLKALKEAFDSVGFPLNQEDKLSFAETGNPVMTLAAFLTRLVEPGVATASARSSLKSMSKSSPGLQLAARHCFILEDPPDHQKEQSGAESVTTEKSDPNVGELIDQECKNKKEINHNQENSTNQNEENQNEEKSTLLLDGTHSTDDDDHKKKGSASGEDLELSSARQDECAEKSQTAQKPDETTSTEQNNRLPNNPKDPDDSASKVELPPGSANESGSRITAAEAVQFTDAPKNIEVESDSVLPDKKDVQERVPPDPVKVVGSGTGEDKMEVDKTGDPKPMKATESKDDGNVAKLKRAAIATLSAAAVKAKLLANQEDDEIRQLATLLIEKQLRKVEIKLSYITEMENAIMRVREQLERSRQKLFNERAQIIASRLGLPASSSRGGLPSSFPMNRMPPSLLNSMLRPPMSMAAQRPPMSRPVMTSTPSTRNTSAPSKVAGGDPTQPSDQEKSSSVGTN